MKKSTVIFLLSAGMLLSLAGCQEKPVTPDGTKEGIPVEFAVTSGSPATRTAFSGEGTGEWERIDWVEGDKILIWSDRATVRTGGSEKSAVYSLTGITSSGNESHAKLSDPTDTGLQYVDKGEHAFWGIYPSSAVSTAPTAGSLSYVIPVEQTGVKEVSDAGDITYKPTMDQNGAVMLAAVEGVKPKEKANLVFYPAFTAFELTFEVDANCPDNSVYLHHVTLTSESGLAGTVAATIATGTREFTVTDGTDEANNKYAFNTNNKTYRVGASTYTASPTTKTVTFNLPAAVELVKGKKLKITFVTLPQNVTDLTIGMYMGQDGSDVRTGKLKIGVNENGAVVKKNLAFAACQKHNLRGVLLKPHDWEFSSITTKLQVLDWEPVPINADAEHFPQSTQISVSEKKNEKIYNAYDDFGMGGKNTPERQMWYFKPGQTITLFMKVMLPASGSWEFVPMGGTEDNPVEADLALFTIKNVSPAVGETPTNPDNLWGPIRETGSTDVNLEITYTGTDTENQHSLYFHTYVYSGANKTGTRFNIDSETQLYDRGRGYHTFFVNSPLYPND